MKWETARLPLISTVVLLLVLPACRPSVPSAPQSDESDGVEPAVLLERMRAAYRDATAYQDRGVLRLRYRQQDTPIVDEAPFAMRAVRPNKLRLRAYNVLLGCDGTQLVARIEDKPSNNLDGQVAVRPAPLKVTLRDLYRDAVLRDAIVGGLGRQPIPLELFFDDKPLEAVFPPSVVKRLLPTEECEGHSCHRVEATTAEGLFVFWIDAETFLLRRLEYPVRAMLPDLPPEEEPNTSLVADFSEATFSEDKSPESFQIPIPANAKTVRTFVVPPEPLPTTLLGKTPNDFSLTSLQGARVKRDDLRGRTTVLAWFQNHPACQRYLQQLDLVRKQLEPKGNTTFHAVCTEPSVRTSEEIAELLASWQVALPVLRDLDACGRDVFAIPWAPTIVVLDKQGVVQLFEVGANPYLSEQLPVVLERIERGDAVADEILADHRRDAEAYQKAVASGGPTVTAGTEQAAQPRKPSDPQRLRLEPLWTCRELNEPGNLLVTPGEQNQDHILVLTGKDRISELDLNGKRLAEHRFEPLQGAGYLRSDVDAQGRRYFAATAIRGDRCVVFDQRWQAVGTYPPPDFPHAGITDVQLADADADGQPELFVSFAGVAGVHCVNLRGSRLWVNHGLPDVQSLAIAQTVEGERWGLLATGSRGQLLRIDATGTLNRPVLAQHPWFRICAYSGEDRPVSCYCGVTFDADGKLIVHGLDNEFRSKWFCDLPAAVYRYPVQFISCGGVPGAAGIRWIVAGSDGVIHLMDGDGELQDQFAVGQHVRGLALARRATDAILLVSLDGEVKAWRICAPR